MCLPYAHICCTYVLLVRRFEDDCLAAYVPVPSVINDCSGRSTELLRMNASGLPNYFRAPLEHRL